MGGFILDMKVVRKLTSTFKGEYSSSGMIRSCKYLNLKRMEPHSPIGVTPRKLYLKYIHRNRLGTNMIITGSNCTVKLVESLPNRKTTFVQENTFDSNVTNLYKIEDNYF